MWLPATKLHRLPTDWKRPRTSSILRHVFLSLMLAHLNHKAAELDLKRPSKGRRGPWRVGHRLLPKMPWSRSNRQAFRLKSNRRDDEPLDGPLESEFSIEFDGLYVE